MKTKTKNQSRVKEGKTELTVDHNGKDLTFIHPSYGPNTYANVAQEIDQTNLLRPTMAQTASLIHAAFNSDDKYSNEIKDLMRKRWLWAFTGTLYVPSKGAYVQDDPRIKEGMPFMEESDLIKKLEAKDPSVRFAPFGYKTGKMTSLELWKNPYVVALAGEEGAEKLAEVADKHKINPYLWSFDNVNETLTRVSTVDSDWGSEGRRLGVSGDDLGDLGGDRGSGAFGVQKKTGEASRAKK